MAKFVMAFLSFLLTLSCVSKSDHTGRRIPEKEEKEFEGIVKYHISYMNNDDSASYGDTLTLYYSKGKMIRQYNGQSRDGLKREIFLSANNAYYMNIGTSDTLYSYDITKEHNISLEKVARSSEETKIMGFPCEMIEFHLLHRGQHVFYIHNKYLYSKHVLPVNRDYFKDWKYSDFNQFISEAGTLYLQFETGIQKYGMDSLATKIFTAVEIKEQPLDEKIFMVDTRKMKEFKVD